MTVLVSCFCFSVRLFHCQTFKEFLCKYLTTLKPMVFCCCQVSGWHSLNPAAAEHLEPIGSSASSVKAVCLKQEPRTDNSLVHCEGLDFNHKMVCNRWQHHDTVQVLVPTWSDKRNRRLAFGSFKKMDMCKSWHASFHEALADQLCVFANRQRSSKKRTNTSKYSLSITQSPPKKNIVKALHESLSPPFKAAKGLLDFPLLPRESPHRDSHSLLWRVAVLHCPWWIGEEDDITYKSGEFAKFLQCAMVIFRGRQGIPKFHDIWYGEKNRTPSRRRHVPKKLS